MYIIAGVAIAATRLPRFSERSKALQIIAFSVGLAGLIWHGRALVDLIVLPDGIALSLSSTASFIGLQLALIAVFGAIEPTLRGLAGGLFLLGAGAAAATGLQVPAGAGQTLAWQMQVHIVVSLFAYGLLTVGAIVAVYSLIQDRRLHAGRLSTVNRLFAPLETTEKLLYGIAGAGFSALLLAVLSGFVFVDDLFAQHLVHKTFLSILALVLFGVLLGGRQFAGWRGRRAVYLYLWGFAILCLAYFGSRYILEQVLGRSWG
ncbi:MAG: inner membrane protein YpjD [Woeseia sp.]